MGKKFAERATDRYSLLSKPVTYNVYMNLYFRNPTTFTLTKRVTKDETKDQKFADCLANRVNFKIVLIAQCSVLKNLEAQSV